MPIQTPLKSQLEVSIRSAFENSKKSGSIDGADSDNITRDLAKEITDAIDSYIKGIIVTTNVSVTIPTPVPVVTPTGPGSIVTPLVGTGTGTS